MPYIIPALFYKNKCCKKVCDGLATDTKTVTVGYILSMFFRPDLISAHYFGSGPYLGTGARNLHRGRIMEPGPEFSSRATSWIRFASTTQAVAFYQWMKINPLMLVCPQIEDS